MKDSTRSHERNQIRQSGDKRGRMLEKKIGVGGKVGRWCGSEERRSPRWKKKGAWEWELLFIRDRSSWAPPRDAAVGRANAG